MPERVTLPCGGLVTDPSPHMTYPSGALRRADDVIVCAAGVAQVRPSFPTLHEKATDYRPLAMQAFDGDVIVVSEDGGAYRIENSSATISSNATPPDITVSPTQFVEARKSLYYTSSTGVRKLLDAGAVSAPVAGLDMLTATLSGTSSGATGPFQAPATWAYRIVFVAKDANGYVRRSPPSARIEGVESGAATFYIDWTVNGGRVYFPTWLAAGDSIEFYRTKMTTSATAVPSTECYLAFTVALTASDITNGYINPPNDRVSDDQLGAALYTNPSQQGIADAKEPPPWAVALSSFGRCAWYGNTTGKHRISVALTDAAGNGINTTGIQYRSLTGDFTLGSDQIANVASSAGLVVGMAVTDAATGPTAAGTNIPAVTKITAITGAGPYTVTMDKNALATNAGAAFTARDIVKIGGVEFYASSLTTIPGVVSRPQCFIADAGATESARAARTAKYIEFAVNYHALTNPSTFKIRATATGFDAFAFGSYGGSGELHFSEVGLGGSSFTLTSTRPEAFAPDLSTSGITSDNDRAPHRLYWSEPDEPEAVPLGQYVDIGSESEPILALVPLRTALLVFKTDGVWSVSGVAPNSWSLDLLDATQRLVRGGCVDTINNTAIAWTTSGVVAVNEVAVRSLTDGRISRQFAPYSSIMAATPATAGAFVSAWRAANCVLVGVPVEADAAQATYLYCWHAGTNAWTRWTNASYCAAHSASTFYLARGGEYWELRGNSDGLTAAGSYGYDATHTIAAWTYAGLTSLTVTYANAGDWAPVVGDFLRAGIGDGGEFRRITAVEDTGTTFVLTLASAFSSSTLGSLVAYEAIDPVMQWQAHSVSPVHSALYSEAQYLFDFTDRKVTLDTSPAVRFLLGAQNERVTGAETEEWSETASASKLSTIARIHPSREIARATHLFPYLECGGALHFAWRCLGVGLVFEPASERTAR